MRRAAAALVLVLGLSGSAGARSNLASSPIVFESTRDGNSEIYAMNPDGSDQTRLTNNTYQDAAPSFARNGRIAFASNRSGNWDIYTTPSIAALLKNPNLTPTPVTSAPTPEFAPEWSPDGTRIVYEHRNGPNRSDVWIADASGETNHPLTHLSGENFAATWAPDGSEVALVHRDNRRYHIVVATLDGAVVNDLSAKTGHNADFDPDWSPSGAQIVFSRQSKKGNYDIWVMDASGGGEVRLTTSRDDEFSPTWSPDGSQIAYVRGRDGAYDIWVMNAKGSDQHNITNSAAGADVAPDWEPRPSVLFSLRAPSLRPRAAGRSAGFFCTQTGTARPNTLVGSSGRDVLCGLGGNDRLFGVGGDDVLAGGLGNDRMMGQTGADELFARSGIGRETDVVSGGAGASDMAWVDRRDDRVNRDVEVKRPP
jgi:TolB protein